MSDSVFFYTDIAHLNTQDPSWNFGPTSPEKNRSFRTSNRHSSTQDTPAYSVCQGLIAGHVSSITNDVCLLLKPTVPLFYNTWKVRYVIYNGIRRDSVLDGDDTHLAPDETSDLVGKFWETHRALGEDRPLHDLPPQEKPTAMDTLGIGRWQEDGSIDQMFYNRFESFQPMMVKPGWSLGVFRGSEFSVHICFEGLHAPILLQDVIGTNTVIQATDPASLTTSLESWQDAQVRDQALAYLDAGALFASCYPDGIQAMENGSIVTLMGDDLYSKIFAKFATKHCIYLEILEENEPLSPRSSWLEPSLHFGVGSSQLNHNYETHAWPLFILDTDTLPTIDTDALMALAVSVSLKQPVNFLAYQTTGPSSPTDIPRVQGQNRLFPLTANDASTRLSPFVLACPQITVSSNHHLLSAYFQIILKKRDEWFQPDSPTPTTTGVSNHPHHVLNHIFYPFRQRKGLLADTATIQNRCTHLVRLIESPDALVIPQALFTGVAKDQQHVFFFTLPLAHHEHGIIHSGGSFSIPEWITDEYSDFFELLNHKLNDVSVVHVIRNLPDLSEFHELVLTIGRTFRPSLLTSPKKLFVFAFTHDEFTQMNQIKDSTTFLNEDDVSLSFRVSDTQRDQSGTSFDVLEPFLCGDIISNQTVMKTFIPINLRLYHYHPSFE